MFIIFSIDTFPSKKSNKGALKNFFLVVLYINISNNKLKSVTISFKVCKLTDS